MGVGLTRKTGYPVFVYLSLLAGAAATLLLMFVNSIVYFSGFWGKVFRAPIVEETAKSISLFFVIKRAMKEGELSDLNLYTLGAFTGLAFGVLESIMTYRVLVKPVLLPGRVLATLGHVAYTTLDGVGISEYLSTGEISFLVKRVFLAMFLHGLWNYWVNAPF